MKADQFGGRILGVLGGMGPLASAQFMLRLTLLTPAERRKTGEMYVDALNHALRGIPTDRVRYHTCYGINEGPRVHDAPLADLIDVVLKVNAGAYSFEAANPRHEHEYRLWETVKLPEGKSIIPGVIRPVRDAKGPVKVHITVPTQNGWKAIGLSNGARQELFISTPMTQEQLETALAEAIGMYQRAGYQAIGRYNDNPWATHFFEKAV